jgi:hypothetical protein
MDLNVLYRLIRSVAVTRGMITYDDLSAKYTSLTGATPPSEHTTWNESLGHLNERLFQANIGAPAISVLVVYDHHPEPGIVFWGPSAWARIVEAIHDYDWPPTLPLAPDADFAARHRS